MLPYHPYHPVLVRRLTQRSGVVFIALDVTASVFKEKIVEIDMCFEWTMSILWNSIGFKTSGGEPEAVKLLSKPQSAEGWAGSMGTSCWTRRLILTPHVPQHWRDGICTCHSLSGSAAGDRSGLISLVACAIIEILHNKDFLSHSDHQTITVVYQPNLYWARSVFWYI